jgi:lysophospholipase L1-like esterase
MRLYVESQMERLRPDLLAVYVGHNDVLTRMAVPYRTLYAQYLAARGGASAGAQRLAGWLGGSRLYMGLTYALLGLRDHEAAVAVPVPDARENLRVVQGLAHAAGARVVFMSEGLAPDPAPMAPYTAMLRGLAEDGGDLFVDTAAALHAARNPDLFIDDCHLTEQGHAFVAARVEEALVTNGWIEAP